MTKIEADIRAVRITLEDACRNLDIPFGPELDANLCLERVLAAHSNLVEAMRLIESVYKDSAKNTDAPVTILPSLPIDSVVNRLEANQKLKDFFRPLYDFDKSRVSADIFFRSKDFGTEGFPQLLGYKNYLNQLRKFGLISRLGDCRGSSWVLSDLGRTVGKKLFECGTTNDPTGG